MYRMYQLNRDTAVAVAGVAVFNFWMGVDPWFTAGVAAACAGNAVALWRRDGANWYQ
jgi:hypothetical protein